MFQSINNAQPKTIVQSITNAQPGTIVQSITNAQLQPDIKDQLEAKDQPEIKNQSINTEQLIAEDSNNLNWMFELQDIFEDSYQLQDISEGSYQNIEESYDDLYENNEPEDSIVSEIYSDLDEDSYEDDESEDSIVKEIYSGQTFISFEILEQCLKRYANRTGFEIRTIRSEKEEGNWSRKTYKCHHGGKYKAKKKVDPTQNRDKESVRIECEFTVNASYCRSENLVFVNKFVSQHNHDLQNQDSLQEFSPALRKIPGQIMDEIQFYVQEYHIGATVLKKILRKKYPNQDIHSQDLYNAIHKFKTDAQVKNDAAALFEHLVQLLPRVSNTIFKCIDETFKKYLTPNLLALQRKQMVESLLYRVKMKDLGDVVMQELDQYSIGFLEDDYEEPQVLVSMALKDCSESILSEIWEEGLLLKEKVQENSIWLIQTEDTELQTGTFQTLSTIRGQEIFDESFTNLNSRKDLYGRSIGLCKKALNLAILNNSTQSFEELLQQFIKQQNTSIAPNNNLIESSKNMVSITNPLQHKGKGRPTNKRHLSAIENQPSREKKKNKRQCSICKSWYHDSRNCSVKD
ncbi:8429_t:CDS:2, partial [Racocetra fulgida]